MIVPYLEFAIVVLIFWLLICYAAWGGLVFVGVLIFNAWCDLNLKGWGFAATAMLVWYWMFVYGFSFIHSMWVAL